MTSNASTIDATIFLLVYFELIYVYIHLDFVPWRLQLICKYDLEFYHFIRNFLFVKYKFFEKIVYIKSLKSTLHWDRISDPVFCVITYVAPVLIYNNCGLYIFIHVAQFLLNFLSYCWLVNFTYLVFIILWKFDNTLAKSICTTVVKMNK